MKVRSLDKKKVMIFLLAILLIPFLFEKKLRIFLILFLIQKVLLGFLVFPYHLGIELFTFIYLVISIHYGALLVVLLNLVISPIFDTLKTFFIEILQPPWIGDIVYTTIKWFGVCILLQVLFYLLKIPFPIAASICVILRNVLDCLYDYWKGQLNLIQKIGNAAFNLFLFNFLPSTPIWNLAKPLWRFPSKPKFLI